MKDTKHCAGCRDDFYNGHNNLGVKECWMLKKARLRLRKMVHRDQVPPWNQKPIKVPSCYRPNGPYVMVPKDVTR